MSLHLFMNFSLCRSCNSKLCTIFCYSSSPNLHISFGRKTSNHYQNSFLSPLIFYSFITFRKTFSKIPVLTLSHFTTFYKKSQASTAKRRPFPTAFYRLSIYSCSHLQTPLQGNLQAHFRASPALSPQGLLA